MSLGSITGYVLVTVYIRIGKYCLGLAHLSELVSTKSVFFVFFYQFNLQEILMVHVTWFNVTEEINV